ncbi:hypothetical protein [Bartonella rattaustraliani]|nr:hypothetical protein [Bartonella rattaustraliani]
MSKDQDEIGKVNCIEFHPGAAIFVVLFSIADDQISFIGGDYGCCL